MIIPYEQISAQALRGLVEEFITREGTDYGELEVDLATKVEQVMAQLQSGEIAITFDEASETVTLTPADQL